MTLQQLLHSMEKLRSIPITTIVENVPKTHEIQRIEELAVLRVEGLFLARPFQLPEYLNHPSLKQEHVKDHYRATIDFLENGIHPKIKFKKMIIERPTLQHQVQVRCTCPDYYYMWWFANAKHLVHQGSPLPKYQHVPNSNYPAKNPKHIPGVCKHLAGLVYKLHQEHLL